MNKSAGKKSGFSLVEVVLASSILFLMVSGLVGILIYSRESTAIAGSRTRAVYLAEEGLEAARDLRNADFNNLTDGIYGLDKSGGQWALAGAPDISGIYTRKITIAAISSTTKSVESQVSWLENQQRSGAVDLTAYFTNWPN
jgi:Tfp pilus assembly protein PilV